jgi:2-polyprenyl-6-methoxyphenol hydroxylase-like FAD-dependent oxidoreductase
MMLGLLLGRAGVKVMVLEKHGDFLRDFRGDTVHPSTMEVMHQLGLLERFLELPHRRMDRLRMRAGDFEVTMADFTHVPMRCRFIAFMPQWDFLNFIATEARRYPSFELRMSTEATGLIEEAGTFAGVRAQGPSGPLEVRASLVVGANGRQSELRRQAGLETQSLGAPMDVMWFRLSRSPDDVGQTTGTFDKGRMLVILDRGEHWQVGYVIPKGTLEQVRGAGLDAFRDAIAKLQPFLRERVNEIRSWDDVKLLTVLVDRLRQWYRPGLLFIGDAAHAMSPVGGVGINLAIQDAVATANAVAGPLRRGALTTDHLRGVQRRRMLPTRATQKLQMLVQEQVIRPTLAGAGDKTRVPPMFRLVAHVPLLRRVPAYLIGVGLRFERVKTPVAGGIPTPEVRVPVVME